MKSVPGKVSFHLRLIIPGTYESEKIINESLNDFIHASSVTMPKKYSELKILDKLIVLINEEIAGVASIVGVNETLPGKSHKASIRIYIKDSAKAREFVKNFVGFEVTHPHIYNGHVLIFFTECEIRMSKKIQLTSAFAHIREFLNSDNYVAGK
jgi:hypothetical protein